MIQWQHGRGVDNLGGRYRLLRVKLRSPDGRFKITEKIEEPGFKGYPLFDGGKHVATHRLLREARAAAEARL